MNTAASPRRAQPGFTIVELLVAIGIVLVLAGLLFPVLGFARARARESACVAQLHQIGQAFEMYLSDYEAHRPSYLHQLYPGYVNDQRLFICPNDAWVDRGGWAWSAWGQFSTPPRKWPFAVSYGYFWRRMPTDTRADTLWIEMQNRSPRAGYAVCVLHGEPCQPPFMEGAAPWHQGLTLRVTFDGAVVRRQIRYEANQGCFNVPRLLTE